MKLITYNICSSSKSRLHRMQESQKTAAVDRQAMQLAERRLIEERRKRNALESQLHAEQKQRRALEERAAR